MFSVSNHSRLTTFLSKHCQCSFIYGMFLLFMTNSADDDADLTNNGWGTDMMQLLHNKARKATPRCPVRTVSKTRGQFESNPVNSRPEHFSVAVEVHFTHKYPLQIIGRNAGQVGEEEPCIFSPIVFKMERLFACENQLTACIFPGNFNLSLELLQIGPLFT